MDFSEWKYLICSDLYRITGQINWMILVRHVLFGESYKYIFWMRTCAYTKSHAIFRYVIYPFAKLYLRRLRYKLGISIPPETQIGSGFYIGHFGGIVVNERCIIGKNCNLSHGVTLGQVNRGPRKGCPIIGDNVYIGPGAKIIGAVRVGNNVAIGANCVVTKDVPDNAVVVGVPGKIISFRGSQGYVNRTEYDMELSKRLRHAA
ncbi:serine O-acetyltransferase [Thermogutta sp.]|uniref:serine O-acetyltransferase n=1 Tax=Thermogutta sp. TaxID=1962930 RepID=UPI00321F8437